LASPLLQPPNDSALSAMTAATTRGAFMLCPLCGS
jgi:hypothetical protein